MKKCILLDIRPSVVYFIGGSSLVFISMGGKIMKKVLFLLTISIVFITACELPSQKEILFEATGTVSSVNVQYQNGGGDLVELVNVSLPWERTTNYESGTPLFLSVQNNEAAGTVTATISIDGAVYKTETVVAAFGYVAVTGSVP